MIMKEKIISAIIETEKAGRRKIPLDSAEYFPPFEKLYESDSENFCSSLADLREDEKTDGKILLHAMHLSAHFGVETETLSRDMRALYEKCFTLEKSLDVWAAMEGLFLSLEADELLKSFAGGEERRYFENFISLAEVTDIQTAGLYDLCAKLHLVKPTPKYIKEALRASVIIDGLYGTVLWQYYLEHTSLTKIERDICALEKVGFEKIPQMIRGILAKMKESNFSSRKEKARFCEKFCLKNKPYIEEIMEKEENIIEKYIISFKTY